jgi:hypothetical protein
MRTILIKIAGILVAILILDRSLAYLFQEAIFNKTLVGESGGTINYALQNKKNLDFLVLGSSRARYQVDPKQITALGTNGYNLGVSGTNVINSDIILDILLNNQVRSKTLIVQTDLRDYIGVQTHRNKLDQVRSLYPYANQTKLIAEYVQASGWQEEIKFFFNLYKYNGKMLNITFNFLKSGSVEDNVGYVGLPDVIQKPGAPLGAESYQYNQNSLSTNALLHIAELCKENSIRLIVVIPPSYKNNLYNKDEQLKMDDDLREKNFLTIIDMADVYQYPELLDDLNWKDDTHLNAVGAEKFSRLLNTKIAELKP